MTARLGLIGLGRWGKRYIETIDRLPDMQLVRACARHPEQWAAALPADVAIETDWRALCAARDLDGIIIASPPSLHAAMLQACLEARTPALVEKPLCLSIEEAVALERQARATDVPVLVDHIHLFHAAFAALRAKLPEPAAVRFIRAECEAYGPFRPGQAPVLWDRAPHAVAMCLDLLGTGPERVTCLAAFAPERSAWDRHMLCIRLEFATGTVAWIQVGHLETQKRLRFSAYGPDRLLVFDDLAQPALVEYENSFGDEVGAFAELGAPQAIDAGRELPLDRVLREFVAGIAGRPSHRFGLRLAVAVTHVLHAADVSMMRGAEAVRLSSEMRRVS